MAGFVAAAIVGGAVIGGISSSSAARSQSAAATEAARTQSDAAVRVAEIETGAAERAAAVQAQAFRDAAAAQEAGITAAGGIERGALDRAPGPITQAELGQFNQAVAQGRYDEAARLAASANVAPETVAAYLNQNAANLNLPGPVSAAQVSDLMGQARITAGGIRGAGEIQARAAEQAARQQAEAQLRAARLQTEQAERAFELQQGFLSPFRDAGVNALARIQAGLTPGGEFAQPFTAEQFQADPGYAFRLSEGQKALERQSAARGGLMSGSALKAATRFGQEMGSQEFQNAFNRYYAEREAQLNPLFSLYGGGLAASGNLSGAAGTMGANVANYLGAGETGAAQSRAQGILGAGAARSSSYLEDLQARAQAQRDLASTRASAFTGPAQFAAQGILGAGRATAGGLQQSAAATSQGLLQAGQARAAGQLGIGNALTGALGSGLGYYQQQQLLNRLYPTGGAGAPAVNPTIGNFPTFSFG
jgi:hypothetical protein